LLLTPSVSNFSHASQQTGFRAMLQSNSDSCALSEMHKAEDLSGAGANVSQSRAAGVIAANELDPPPGAITLLCAHSLSILPKREVLQKKRHHHWNFDQSTFVPINAFPPERASWMPGIWKGNFD
jgi:hypothetical protein